MHVSDWQVSSRADFAAFTYLTVGHAVLHAGGAVVAALEVGVLRRGAVEGGVGHVCLGGRVLTVVGVWEAWCAEGARGGEIRASYAGELAAGLAYEEGGWYGRCC